MSLFEGVLLLLFGVALLFLFRIMWCLNFICGAIEGFARKTKELEREGRE